MAYKVFSNGDALTGGELNTYLMNQAVISFATTTARDAALPSPSEGQLVWLEDSNKYVYYTGSAWSDLITPASSGNAIINGAFEINQRNFTSNTTSGDFNFDRWRQANAGGTFTLTPQTFTLGSAPVSGYEGKNYLRGVVASQSAASDYAWFYQMIESVRTFAGETVTVSFFAKAASGTPKMAVELNQFFGVGGSPSASVPTYAGQVTLSTSWARYSLTVGVPSIAGKTLGTTGDHLRLNIMASAGSDFNARSGSLGTQNNTFDIWGVQLEAGSSATAFKRNASNIQGELAACQRYYWRTQSQDVYSMHGMGSAYSTTAGCATIPFPIVMRVKPTSVDYANLRLDDNLASFAIGTLTLIANTSSANMAQVNLTGLSGLTQYRTYNISNNNNAAGFIGFSAEL